MRLPVFCFRLVVFFLQPLVYSLLGRVCLLFLYFFLKQIKQQNLHVIGEQKLKTEVAKNTVRLLSCVRDYDVVCRNIEVIQDYSMD